LIFGALLKSIMLNFWSIIASCLALNNYIILYAHTRVIEITPSYLGMNPTDPFSQFNIYHFKLILFGAANSLFILNASFNIISSNMIQLYFSQSTLKTSILHGCDTDKAATDYYKEHKPLCLVEHNTCANMPLKYETHTNRT